MHHLGLIIAFRGFRVLRKLGMAKTWKLSMLFGVQGTSRLEEKSEATTVSRVWVCRV